MTRSESSKGSVSWSTAGSSNGYPTSTTVGVVNHDPTRQRAPCYSFGVRLAERTRPSPGPQYKVESGLTARGSGNGPSYSITGRPKRSTFDVLAASSGPGPNAYRLPPPAAHSSHEPRAPTYSFGLPHHAPAGQRGARLPAPNSYSLPTTLGPRVPHVRGAPASTLRGKGSDNKGFSFDHANTPGPAGYGPVDPARTAPRAPAASLKGRLKLPPLKFVTPGPGAYDPGRGAATVAKASPRFSMGVRHGEHVRPLFTLADVSD